MARFRTYKNGITGHKHKGYYIIRTEGDGGKNRYLAIDENKVSVTPDFDNYLDCEWEVDKLTSSKTDLDTIKELYDKETIELSYLFTRLLEKKEQNGLTDGEKRLYEWVEKVRLRKKEGKPF